ncbi:hypothetical protein FFA01_19500 [Frigoribacterium faeni]|uniref:Uncharacterized protein n=1 Tax=Frigoribacterium faeni TaxID=145483 RepID=A0ABQ0UTR3_9MICO|nr:hypothetical protein GCM10025699_39930 [Microbacterium flavescens]GEK83641.1 hypothetical protein FFA01_19500 [Frigoribacterium faeni]
MIPVPPMNRTVNADMDASSFFGEGDRPSLLARSSEGVRGPPTGSPRGLAVVMDGEAARVAHLPQG